MSTRALLIGGIGLVLLFTYLALSHATEGLRVIDGDTIDLYGERIRISNMDAPEIFSSNCPEELQWGVEARNELEAMLAPPAKIAVISTGKRDIYGRTLARIEANGIDAGTTLIALRLAVPWTGHRYGKWCLKRRVR